MNLEFRRRLGVRCNFLVEQKHRSSEEESGVLLGQDRALKGGPNVILRSNVSEKQDPGVLELPYGPQKLLDRLRWWAKKYGPDSIYPKLAKLAKGLGVVARTVQRWLAVLIECGHVEVIRRYRRSNLYRLIEHRQMSFDFGVQASPVTAYVSTPPATQCRHNVATVVTPSLRTLRKTENCSTWEFFSLPYRAAKRKLSPMDEVLQYLASGGRA